MVFIACSGFPVPVSRYWKEFPAVEISDTEIAIPGTGTVRRWIRESPNGFAFTVLAPKAIADSGFRRTNENKAHCEAICDLANQLRAKAVVFAAEPEFKATKASRTALRSFLGILPKKMPPVVLDLPGWDPNEVLKTCGDRPAIAAYDPLHDKPPKSGGKLAYLRLPGPAGHRSRYDEASIDEVAKHCESIDAKTAFCVFRNIDMQANATQLIKKLE